MAEEHFILQVLHEMQEYYHQTYNQTQVMVFCRQLKAVPAYLLRQAVDRWLDSESRFLPRGAHLLQLAREIHGHNDFQVGLEEPDVPLWIQFDDLKSAYYQEGFFDRTRWESLISLAEALDSQLIASAIRNSLRFILEPQTEAQCLAYASWVDAAWVDAA